MDSGAGGDGGVGAGIYLLKTIIHRQKTEGEESPGEEGAASRSD